MPDYSKTKIQFRRGLADEFVQANPILASGEPAFAEGVFKIGDGTSDWGELSQIGGGGGSSKQARAITLTNTSYENYSPSVLADVVRVTDLADHTTIKSINSTYSLKQFILINDDVAGFNIIINHMDNTQTASNRVHASPSSDIVLRYGHSAILTYDAGESLWVGQKVTSTDIVSVTQTNYTAMSNAVPSQIQPNTIYVVT